MKYRRISPYTIFSKRNKYFVIRGDSLDTTISVSEKQAKEIFKELKHALRR